MKSLRMAVVICLPDLIKDLEVRRIATYIIDELMGRGKTTAMKRFVNETVGDRKFLFITPYLDDINTIKRDCSTANFYSPTKNGSKSVNLKRMLRKGRNIVATHKLFSMMDNTATQIVRDQGYTLIMDEVASVINQVDASFYDISDMTTKYTSLGEGDIVTWNDRKYNGQFEKYMKLVDDGVVYAYNDNYWITVMKPELFTSYKDIFLMTYLFHGQMQRAYFDLKGIKYSYLYVSGDTYDTYHLSDIPHALPPLDYRSKVHILENDKLNMIGDDYHALSKRWYIENHDGDGVDLLRRNSYNYFHNILKSPAEQNMWTCFGKDKKTNFEWRHSIAGDGYTKGFLPCNSKGTNKYRHKRNAAYLINCFPNQYAYNFISKHGVKLNRDDYALSELVQWLWRSAIRDRQDINLYIPSRRMRELLVSWLDTISKE